MYNLFNFGSKGVKNRMDMTFAAIFFLIGHIATLLTHNIIDFIQFRIGLYLRYISAPNE